MTHAEEVSEYLRQAFDNLDLPFGQHKSPLGVTVHDMGNGMLRADVCLLVSQTVAKEMTPKVTANAMTKGIVQLCQSADALIHTLPDPEEPYQINPSIGGYPSAEAPLHVAEAVQNVDVNNLPVNLRESSEALLQLWADKHDIERPTEYTLAGGSPAPVGTEDELAQDVLQQTPTTWTAGQAEAVEGAEA